MPICASEPSHDRRAAAAEDPRTGGRRRRTRGPRPSEVWSWDITYLRSSVRGGRGPRVTGRPSAPCTSTLSNRRLAPSLLPYRSHDGFSDNCLDTHRLSEVGPSVLV